jgi:hypothetical protein
MLLKLGQPAGAGLEIRASRIPSIIHTCLQAFFRTRQHIFTASASWYVILAKVKYFCSVHFREFAHFLQITWWYYPTQGFPDLPLVCRSALDAEHSQKISIHALLVFMGGIVTFRFHSSGFWLEQFEGILFRCVVRNTGMLSFRCPLCAPSFQILYRNTRVKNVKMLAFRFVWTGPQYFRSTLIPRLFLWKIRRRNLNLHAVGNEFLFLAWLYDVCVHTLAFRLHCFLLTFERIPPLLGRIGSRCRIVLALRSSRWYSVV